VSDEKFKVWVTKYWDTRGLFQVMVEAGGLKDTRRVFTISGGVGEPSQMFTLGGDAFVSYGMAIEDAERRRDRKVNSLKKKLKTLKAMSFVPLRKAGTR
jgi:hypothetical protein